MYLVRYIAFFIFISYNRKDKNSQGEIMINKVRDAIQKNKLICPKEHIVVGVSGGADSMCLLHILKCLQDEYKLQLTVAHINHGMRIEAKEDAEFVNQICKNWDIPYKEHQCNIVQIAKDKKCSEEEAGRNERYWFFEEIRKTSGADKIAVAHTMNDQAETLLMRLIRGSGMTGLGAIMAKRDFIVRPLLTVSREEVEAYCHQHDIGFKEDQTNKTDVYTRNRLRRHVLPMLKKDFNPKVVEAVAQAAFQLQEAEQYLALQTQTAYQSVVMGDKKGYRIQIEPFLTYHPVIQGRILRMVIDHHMGSLKDINYTNINDILGLFYKQSGKMIHIGKKTVAIREHGYVRIIKEENKSSFSFNLEIGTNEIVQCNKKVEVRVYDDSKSKQRHENAYTKNIDYDKMSGNLQIRNRQAGDRILLKGGSKKLKDFFIDEKIPRSCRDDVLLIADHKNIIWVVGYRLSEAYYITDKTKRILQIQIVDIIT